MGFIEEFQQGFAHGQALRQSKQDMEMRKVQFEREQETHDLNVKSQKLALDAAKFQQQLHAHQAALQGLTEMPVGQGTSAPSSGLTPQDLAGTQGGVPLASITPSATSGQLTQPTQQLPPNAATPGYQPVTIPGVGEPGQELIPPQTTTAAALQSFLRQRAAMTAAAEPFTLNPAPGGTATRYVGGVPIASVTSTAPRFQEQQPLGQRVPQLNDLLTQRWQVSNPGMEVPKSFLLNPDATEGDFNRIDKALQQTESAHATAAQREQANSFRQQSLMMAQQAQADREMSPVIGYKDGKPVLVSLGESRKMGLTGAVKADAQDVTKAFAARSFLPLADRINQDLDVLEKRGLLKGPGGLANRFQEFMAGQFGAGDPDFERLRVDSGLANTLLMNFHVGTRGSSYLMEHFEDLANAKKMNPETLRAGIEQERKYAENRAMMPAAQQNAHPDKILGNQTWKWNQGKGGYTLNGQ